MKRLRSLLLALVLSCCATDMAMSQSPTLNSQSQIDESGATALIRASSEKMIMAFNAGKVDEIAGMFLPRGEMIDESGTLYQGQQEIKDVLTELFKQFPGMSLTVNTDSLRIVGQVGIEEGTRIMKTKDGASQSQFRYIAIWGKDAANWKIVSWRDIADEPAPTPHDYLKPLDWLVGEWVNQGADGSVAISYRWSEDKNYLLGDFKMSSVDAASRTSTQRIGWDANAGRVRSWLFDADGGFSEGVWNIADDSIVIKSTSTNPDGTTASATLKLLRTGKDSFSFTGNDRIVGGSREPDFELKVTRQSPKPNH